MANFLAELKRRHIYRVAAAYAVVAWVLLQIVNNIIPLMQAPVWTGQFCLLLLALGFPIAVFFAWMRELSAPDAAAPVRTSVMDGALIGVLVIVIALISYQQFASAPLRSSSLEAAREASVKPAGISIAVLPFANLSSDKEQEFFSDGMTEEITSALAKIPDLRVVGRTSAFQFKGQNQDLRAIGQALSATHLLEGSVRKEANRVRITAQLILAENGVHVWTESYDRELTGVFIIQEDIATAIAGALRMPLGLKPGETLVHGTQNLGTYQEYLQAKVWLRDRASPRTGPFLETLESVVVRDPGFAPAWAVLARAYLFQITSSPAVPEGPVEEARRVVLLFRQKAEMAAQKAIQLDPQHPGGYAAMANLRWGAGQWAAAEDAVKQSLALDPNDTDALTNYWNILLKTGRPKEALAVAEKVRTLEPLVPAYDIQVAMILQVNGQNEAAIAVFEAIPANGRSRLGYGYLARAYAAAGRYAEAADTLLLIAGSHPNPRAKKGLQDAAAVLRTAPAKATDQKALPELGPSAGDLIFVYASVGAFDRVMDYPEREAQIRYMPDSGKTLWTPVMAPVRKTERFKAFARNTGLVDYWRERAWPSFCHPTTGDDFVCE